MLGREGTDIPVYRKVADQIIDEIMSGERASGSRLPTVRELSRVKGVSHGTAKHIYDVLEREGYLVKAQGSGTFVRQREEQSVGAKTRALAAIDRLLDELHELGLSLRESRIFVDLKLREREKDEHRIRVSAVDCSPEALAMMREQIAALEHTEVDAFLLGPVLQSPLGFEPRADIVVTTATHGAQLAKKMTGQMTPVSLVMSIGAETAVELAAIDSGARVGVLCKSERFAHNILSSCEKYCKLEHPPQVALFGDLPAVREVSSGADVLILAPNYRLFCKGAERKTVEDSLSRARRVLYFYKVEQGSLLYLQDLINGKFSARIGT